MNSNRLAVMVMALTLAAVGPAAADLPPEVSCWHPGEVAPKLANDTLGSLELGTRLKGDAAFRTYVHKTDSWVQVGKLQVIQETLPLVSMNCMRAPAWGYAAGGQYPVVGAQGDYLQLVVDPVEDKRVWVNLPELQKSFFAELHLDADKPVKELSASAARP